MNDLLEFSIKFKNDHENNLYELLNLNFGGEDRMDTNTQTNNDKYGWNVFW